MKLQSSQIKTAIALVYMSISCFSGSMAFAIECPSTGKGVTGYWVFPMKGHVWDVANIGKAPDGKSNEHFQFNKISLQYDYNGPQLKKLLNHYERSGFGKVCQVQVTAPEQAGGRLQLEIYTTAQASPSPMDIENIGFRLDLDPVDSYVIPMVLKSVGKSISVNGDLDNLGFTFRSE